MQLRYYEWLALAATKYLSIERKSLSGGMDELRCKFRPTIAADCKILVPFLKSFCIT